MSEQKLRTHGLRVTDGRLAIVSVFNAVDHALSYQDISSALPEDFDRVTLYRTLKSFEEKGMIHIIPDTEGDPKYALCHSDCSSHNHNDSHVHFKCTACNTTWCLEESAVPEIKLPGGFRADEVTLIVQGACDKCSNS